MRLKANFTLIMLLSMFSSIALADNVLLSAEIKPSVSLPRSEFTNTTVYEGICVEFPGACVSGRKSVATGLYVTDRVLNAHSSDKREHIYQKLNNEWKPITLFHRESGIAYSLKFRLNNLAQRYRRTTGTWNASDFNQAGSTPENGCAGGTNPKVTATEYLFGWLHRTEGAPECYKEVSNLNDVDITIDNISVDYELQTLSSSETISMPNGNYTGIIEYSVGNGQEIDLGLGNYSDNQLRFTVLAEVKHDFIAKIYGSDRIELAPSGGWDNWNLSGSPRFRLEGTGKIDLAASSPFSVSAECTHSYLDTCALQMDGTQQTVPVQINLSIPGMRLKLSGLPVSGVFIPRYREGHPGQIIEPLPPFMRTIGSVDFVVGEASSDQMVDHQGSTWRGGITLIFDAEVGYIPGT
jgi:hypothetical protein